MPPFINVMMLIQENKLGQPFEVDATVYMDMRPAGTSDDLTRTVNYADVHRCWAGLGNDWLPIFTW